MATDPWPERSYGSPVVKVSDHGRHVTSSSPTCRVGERCTLNLSRAETSSRWCGGVVRRGGQLRCRPRHLIMVQNVVAKSPRVAEQCDVNIHSLPRDRSVLKSNRGATKEPPCRGSMSSRWCGS
ncbi:uncharacterized protein TNCV_1120981 [Trichonephila clavipes]|uniref:Uncharacterized protein n=1 Tax=Trichonephila clavipes TaxID=2585209 RepID=A0A8X6SVN4_TRICX|nr:uncharacterized protein TNCV_1120981 [Trichonephila clavipes]